MAIVRRLEKAEGLPEAKHREVDCTYAVVTDDRGGSVATNRYLRIEAAETSRQEEPIDALRTRGGRSAQAHSCRGDCVAVNTPFLRRRKVSSRRLRHSRGEGPYRRHRRRKP